MSKKTDKELSSFDVKTRYNERINEKKEEAKEWEARYIETLKDWGEAEESGFADRAEYLGQKAIEYSQNMQEAQNDVDDLEDEKKLVLDQIRINKSYKSINGNLYTKDGQTLLLYPQGKGGSVFTVPRGVKIISKIAFRSCHHLKTVNIPTSVTNICKGAFFNCDKLQICCEHSRKQAFEEGWNLFNDIGWLFSKKAKVNWGCKIGE